MKGCLFKSIMRELTTCILNFKKIKLENDTLMTKNNTCNNKMF